MKQILTSAIVAASLFSCNGENKKEQQAKKRSQDIVVDEIYSACDCSESFIIVAKEVLGIVSEQQKTDDPNLDHQITPRIKILKQIEEKCQYELKIDLNEVIACDSSIVELIEGLNTHLN